MLVKLSHLSLKLDLGQFFNWGGCVCDTELTEARRCCVHGLSANEMPHNETAAVISGYGRGGKAGYTEQRRSTFLSY